MRRAFSCTLTFDQGKVVTTNYSVLMLDVDRRQHGSVVVELGLLYVFTWFEWFLNEQLRSFKKDVFCYKHGTKKSLHEESKHRPSDSVKIIIVIVVHRILISLWLSTGMK